MPRSRIEDSVEVGDRDWADRGLGAAGDSAGFVQDAALDRAFSVGEGDGAIEILILAHQREVHARRGWVGHNLVDLGYCEISAAGGAAAGFVIDDPIADELQGAA